MKNILPKTALGPKKSPPVLPLEDEEVLDYNTKDTVALLVSLLENYGYCN
jgi:hypothetical protein